LIKANVVDELEEKFLPVIDSQFHQTGSKVMQNALTRGGGVHVF